MQDQAAGAAPVRSALGAGCHAFGGWPRAAVQSHRRGRAAQS